MKSWIDYCFLHCYYRDLTMITVLSLLFCFILGERVRYITVAYAHFFLRIVLAKCRVNFKIVCLLIGNKSIKCLKLLVHFSLIGYLFGFIKNIGTWNFMLTMNKTLWEKSINTFLNKFIFKTAEPFVPIIWWSKTVSEWMKYRQCITCSQINCETL